MRRVLLLLSLLAALAVPPLAHGSYDPLGGGSTAISLDPSFRSLLAANGVRLIARGGVRLRGSRVDFPISGGRLDPVAARGIVEHSGSLVFAAGKRRLPLRGLVLKPAQERSPLAAKFGGGKLKIAAASRLSTRRAGFGMRADVRGIELSGKVATRLGKKLRLPGVFREGQPLGSAVTVAEPSTVAILPAGRVTLAPTPGFLAKLESHFVSLNPISPAELAPGPVFSFTVADGGELAPDASSGSLKLGGTLELLQLGSGGQIFWSEVALDFGGQLLGAETDLEPAPPHRGKLGAVALYDLVGGALSADPGQRSIGVQAASLVLRPEAALHLNEMFEDGAEAFSAGEAVASLGFTVTAR